MRIQGIVFDLDDTLYPEWSYVQSGFAAVARAFADRLAAPFDIAARMAELARSPQRGRVFNALCEEAGVTDPDDCATRMVETYRTHDPIIELFPDARAALDRYRGQIPMGLISDGYLVTQNTKLNALGIREMFHTVLLTDQWGREYWKPHPRAFERMMASLALPPDAILYVSDNPAKDFVAPNRLGWQTVRIVRPGGVHADAVAPSGGQARHTIHSLDELGDALEAD